MGEEGSSNDLMLASVEVLSRLGPQWLEKTEFPKGFEGTRKFDLCGMEPARNRDNSAALFELAASNLDDISVADVAGGLKGLFVGVGREVFVSKDC